MITRRVLQAVVWALTLQPLLPLSVAAASTDPRDPADLLPPPHARRVTYDHDAALQARVFMQGRLERAERDFRGPAAVRSEASLESAVYRLPEGTRPTDLVQHYADQMPGDPAFRCDGRDCGRSNEWANQLLGSALLYGPDGRQSYAAWVTEGRQISVYAIERGNRRVYVNVRVLVPGASDSAAARVRGQLMNQGWVMVPEVVPDPDGNLSAPDLAASQRFAQALGGLEFWVVCHLYSAEPVTKLLRVSAACASRVAEQLTTAEHTPGAFGAGPLMPRTTPNRNRIELVLTKTISDRALEASASSPGRDAP